MQIVFSEFITLNKLTSVHIPPQLGPHWEGNYIKDQPESGSGLSISGGELHHVSKLSETIGNMLQSEGFIYVLISHRYPILYVGITEGGLKSGIFGGGGRLMHHLRKILAIPATRTNHTSGWRAHAFTRYRDNLTALSPSFLDDIYISIAQCSQPKRHEGFVLDKFKPLVIRSHGTCEVMNTAPIKRDPAEIIYPNNLISKIVDEVTLQKTNGT